MQSPAIFLVAATLLLVAMWSSDSAYEKGHACRSATRAETEYKQPEITEQAVQQNETPIIALIVDEYHPQKMTHETPSVMIYDVANVVINNKIQREFSIPTLNKNGQALNPMTTGDCHWMDRANDANQTEIKSRREVPVFFEGDFLEDCNWQQTLTQQVTSVGISLLNFSNKMVTTLIEMHRNQQTTRISAKANQKH